MVTRLRIPAEPEHALVARDCVCDSARKAGVADRDLADMAMAVAGMTADAVRAYRRAERRWPVIITYGRYQDGTYRVAVGSDAPEDTRAVRSFPAPLEPGGGEPETTEPGKGEAELDDRVPACPLVDEPLTVGMRLARDATAVPQARRFVVAVLYALGYDSVATVVELLASELVTNTAMHTPGGAEIAMLAHGGVVRVEVSDRSHDPPVMLPEPPVEEGSGRGLVMVDALASAWGHTLLDGGKVVWFEVQDK